MRMDTHDLTTESGESPPFEEHVRTVVQRLRTALAELLANVGADPTRSQDVARKLRLNRNLTWKISKIIRENDPAAAIPLVPGKEGLRIFLTKLQTAGATTEAIAAAEAAIAEFDRLVEVHSGDRETLELMLWNLSGEGDVQRIEAIRKQSFLGNSAIWGVQARAQLCINVIAPSDSPEWNDLAWVSGLVDFRRLRSDVAWPIASTRKTDDSGHVLPVGDIKPLDPTFAGDHQAPLLGDFCSQPLPALRLETGTDGLLRYYVVEGPIGNTAAATCIIGIVGRRFVRRFRTAGDTIGEHIARLYTPTTLLIHDFFVHRDLHHAMSPGVFLYSQLPTGPPYPAGGRDQGLLPFHESMQELGKPPDVVTPELPTYGRMIEWILGQAGWDGRDFYGFRLRMRFPPTPTLAVFRYPLPEIT